MEPIGETLPIMPRHRARLRRNSVTYRH